MPLRELLFATQFWRLECERGRHVAFLTRLPQSFSSLDEIHHSARGIIRELLRVHERSGVVVDMRSAPPRNDAAFEEAMRPVREAVSSHFVRVAVLLRSTTGLLQVKRLARIEGTNHYATTDEETAIRFASGSDSDS